LQFPHLADVNEPKHFHLYFDTKAQLRYRFINNIISVISSIFQKKKKIIPKLPLKPIKKQRMNLLESEKKTFFLIQNAHTFSVYKALKIKLSDLKS
jgi:hypothetical protein